MSSSWAWATQQVSGWPGLYCKTMSQKTRQFFKVCLLYYIDANCINVEGERNLKYHQSLKSSE
jgi:hypothetical protein